MRTSHHLAVSIAACAGLAIVARSQSWSRFRGPMGAGVAAVSGVPDELSPDRTLVWKTPASRGKSSPVISGDRLYITGWEGEKRFVTCIDRNSGKVLWQKEVARRRTETMNALNDPAAPSPATDGANVYAFFADSALVSYDARGKERWSVALGPFSSVHGIASSPIVAEGLVLLAIEQQVGGSSITAYDASTGLKRWQTALAETGQQGYGTPFVYKPASGDTQVILSRAGEIGAWSIRTGKPVWWVRGTGTQAYSVPAVGDGALFAAADGDTIEGGMQAWEQFLQKKNRTSERTLRVKEDWGDDTIERADRTFGNNDGLLDENEWRLFIRNNQPRSLVAVRLGGTGDVTQTHLLWRTSRAVPTVPSPVNYQKVLYYIRDGGIFTSLDPSTGAVLKEARLPAAPEKYFASPIAADGKIFVISQHGTVTIVKAAADWSVISSLDLGEETYATPAIDQDGRVYIRTSESLYCFARPAV